MVFLLLVYTHLKCNASKLHNFDNTGITNHIVASWESRNEYKKYIPNSEVNPPCSWCLVQPHLSGMGTFVTSTLLLVQMLLLKKLASHVEMEYSLQIP